jgi:hypothetical protein
MKTKLFIALLFLSTLFSCKVPEKCPAYSMNPHSSSMSRGGKETASERMMIYDAHITLEVKSQDSATAKIASIAKKYSGYILNSGNDYTTIRLVSANLKNAMEEASALGKVKDKSINGKDVTDEFTDYQIRLENAERSRKRYLELLEKAHSVEETLKVERELERLNGEIDLLKGKLSRTSHLVEYATLTVYHNEKIKPGPLGYVFVGLYNGVKWLFVRS